MVIFAPSSGMPFFSVCRSAVQLSTSGVLYAIKIHRRGSTNTEYIKIALHSKTLSLPNGLSPSLLVRQHMYPNLFNVKCRHTHRMCTCVCALFVALCVCVWRCPSKDMGGMRTHRALLWRVMWNASPEIRGILMAAPITIGIFAQLTLFARCPECVLSMCVSKHVCLMQRL